MLIPSTFGQQDYFVVIGLKRSPATSLRSGPKPTDAQTPETLKLLRMMTDFPNNVGIK